MLWYEWRRMSSAPAPPAPSVGGVKVDGGGGGGGALRGGRAIVLSCVGLGGAGDRAKGSAGAGGGGAGGTGARFGLVPGPGPHRLKVSEGLRHGSAKTLYPQSYRSAGDSRHVGCAHAAIR